MTTGITAFVCVIAMSAEFVHPGLLHTRADLDRIRQMVQEGRDPWKSGFEVFKVHSQSQASWKLRGPAEEIGRNPNVSVNHHTRISANGRGRFRAIYEQVYNHYVNRVGIPAPYTQRAAERIRPEGPGSPSADHVGFGTLLFSRAQAGVTDKPPAILPAAPGTLVAQGSPSQISLRWVASVDATGYAVRRATTSGGPYTTIAEGIRSATYTDSAVTPGRVYCYVVSASNAAGRGPEAYERGVSAGLPEPWSQKDVGSLLVPGSTGFDGRVFTLEGAGTDISAKGDQFQFAYVPMTGDGEICVRFVPQVSSQFSKFGLMMRDGPGSDSAHVSLLLAPRSGASGGMRGWTACLVIRSSAGAETSGADAGSTLAAPYVAHGRLMEPCWLRLERKGDIFIGSISPDGQTWTQVGSATLRANRSVLAGLAACSCLTQVTTTVMFDNVTAPGRTIAMIRPSRYRPAIPRLGGCSWWARGRATCWSVIT